MESWGVEHIHGWWLVPFRTVRQTNCCTNGWESFDRCLASKAVLHSVRQGIMHLLGKMMHWNCASSRTHNLRHLWWNPVCTKVKQNQVGKARQETYRHHAAVTSWSKTKRKHNIRNKPILHKEYRFHICVHTANTTLVMALTCHVLPVLLHTASRGSETEWYMMTHAM